MVSGTRWCGRRWWSSQPGPSSARAPVTRRRLPGAQRPPRLAPGGRNLPAGRGHRRDAGHQRTPDPAPGRCGAGRLPALTRAAELSPDRSHRGRRLAAAAYIDADVAGGLAHVSRLLDDAAPSDTGADRSLPAAIADAYLRLNGDGDARAAHRLLVAAIDRRRPRRPGVDPELAEALHLVCCSSASSPAGTGCGRSFTPGSPRPGRRCRRPCGSAPVRSPIRLVPRPRCWHDWMARGREPS